MILNDKSLNKQLNEIVITLGNYDYTKIVSDHSSSLFNGHASLSLFHYQLYLYAKEDKFYEKSCLHFEKAYNHIDPDSLNFSYGASGVMWLLNYYKKQKAFNFDFEDFLLKYDELLLERIKEYENNIDPMHGLLSIANYLFSRNNKVTRKGLAKILDILDDSKVVDKDLIFWENGDDKPNSKTRRHVNFGYAHGIPGILFFLTKFIAKGINKNKATDLYTRAFAYLLSYQDTTAKTYFPSHVEKDNIRKNSRVAYCYGDLGISCGFTAIGNMLGDLKLLELAKKMAVNIASLSINNKESLEDIGLCHGAAGNGHMFHKLYQAYRIDILKKASVFQYKKLLELRNKDTNNNIAGFVSIDFSEEKQAFLPKIDPGFINGTTGVGLSILSFLNNEKDSAWDSILYLS